MFPSLSIFISLSVLYSLDTYCVLGPVMGAEGTAVKETSLFFVFASSLFVFAYESAKMANKNKQANRLI